VSNIDNPSELVRAAHRNMRADSKTCDKCHVEKSLGSFTVNRATGQYFESCDDCRDRNKLRMKRYHEQKKLQKVNIRSVGWSLKHCPFENGTVVHEQYEWIM
jgi:hypothetical protein